MQTYENITYCRACHKSDISTVMCFGEQYLASSFVKTNRDNPLTEIKVPLSLMLCRDCGLVQLRETVNRDLLFRDYFYRSGTNPMMHAALKNVAEDVLQKIDLGHGNTILDIGCNDCTMLAFFPDAYQRIGVDPATNINWDNVEPSIRIINDYFSAQAVLKVTEGKPCQVVTSIAMLYSVEDVNTVVASVKSILAPGGVWCIQLSYLPALIKNMTFYDVCHEHLYYFSLTSLNALMQTHGLTIFDASTNEVNGGSLRVFVTHAHNQRAKTVSFYKLLEEERSMCLVDIETYERFFDDVCTLKHKVIAYIQQEEGSGHRVIGLGASTKGNVLLQFFGLDKTLLPYISERNPQKVGLRTLGTDIELISEERARGLHPSCMLVLIWFFKEELLKREQGYLQNGGTLLFPMPYCHLVTQQGEVRL